MPPPLPCICPHLHHQRHTDADGDDDEEDVDAEGGAHGDMCLTGNMQHDANRRMEMTRSMTCAHESAIISCTYSIVGIMMIKTYTTSTSGHHMECASHA